MTPKLHDTLIAVKEYVRTDGKAEIIIGREYPIIHTYDKSIWIKPEGNASRSWYSLNESSKFYYLNYFKLKPMNPQQQIEELKIELLVLEEANKKNNRETSLIFDKIGEASRSIKQLEDSLKPEKIVYDGSKIYAFKSNENTYKLQRISGSHSFCDLNGSCYIGCGYFDSGQHAIDGVSKLKYPIHTFDNLTDFANWIIQEGKK